jgi:uncharacterized membrane protein (UPF0127 family)
MRLNPQRAADRAAALLVVLALLFAGLVHPAHGMRRDTLKLVTSRGVRQITVEVTETPQEKATGLMFRTALADDAGMLFFYDSPQEITMWMRNTYIPLDMVFIRADGRVHRIEASTEPLSDAIIASHGEVTACLELAGGATERLGLNVGDRVEYRLFAAGGKRGR